MRRDGFALAGAGVVMMKELADNLSSVRMRLLEGLVFVAGAGAVYATIGEVRSVVSEDPFVFLRLFTTPKAPLPSFVAFLGFLIPIVAIALGFDSVNSEFNHRTMSRLLAQPGAHLFEPMEGRPMKEYVVFPDEMLADRDALRGWMARGLAYAASLPPKEKKPRKKKA